MTAGGSGPLAGLRVLEIAGLGPTPFCAMMLADLGADVLRIDRPGGNDPGGRRRPPPETEVLNRNRRSAVLDLKHPDGPATLLALADRADVLVEGFRPGVAERLGIGPEVALVRNPGLVYGRMTGWGQGGPLAQRAGHDIAYIARTGALHAIGTAGGPPQIPLNTIGDFGGGGMLLAFGICAALYERQRSGEGQVVDAAIIDGAAVLLAMQYGFLAAGSWRDERGVNELDSGAPWYSVYATADGGWMATGAIEPQFYAELLRVLELANLPDRADRGNWAAIRACLAARFSERTRDEWTAAFAGTDACVAPVLSFTEAPEDQHNRARRTFVRPGGVVQPAPAPRFSRSATAEPRPAGPLGGDTVDALAEWGIADVAALVDSGAAHTARRAGPSTPETS